MLRQEYTLGWPRKCRFGFTLIEIIVVIAIAGILISLTAAGAFQVIAVQRVSNTESLLKQVDNALQSQWQAVLKQANDEPVADQYWYPQFNNAVAPPAQISHGLLGMANNHMGTANNVDARARLIWKKLRLVQQFPMAFGEAASTVPPGPIIGPGNIPYFLTPPLQPGYAGKLRGASVIPASEWENSALLLLTLTQARTGTTRFSTDTLGATSVTDAGAGNGLQALVDPWGRPLVFTRFPIDHLELDALNPADAVTGSVQRVFRDPLDPQGLLMDPSWNNQASFQNNGGVRAFEALCHSVHRLTGNAWTPVSAYQFAIVASGGKNKLYGLTPTFGISAPGDANDNIYSYRLRPGSRGD